MPRAANDVLSFPGRWVLAMYRPDEQGAASEPGPTVASDQLDAVYRDEAPRLLRLLKRKIWIEDDRYDLVHEAFARLAAARSNAARSNPGAYLQGIIRHLLADRGRLWARTQARHQLEVDLTAAPPGPDALAELSDMRARYRAAVTALPPKTREVFVLHRVEELEYKMIAERLGISVRTVEWHLAQAIMRIGKSINPDG
jgi:RNA polymerase sigma-70 factor (ECF subfamily)